MQPAVSEEIIITRTDLLAQRCKEGYFDHAIQHESTHQEPPFVLSIIDWITALWHESQALEKASLETLLYPLQSISLWHTLSKIPPTLSGLAYNAWVIAQNWSIDSQHALFKNTRDTAQWSDWAKQFTRHCQVKHQLDIHLAIPKLIQLNALDKIHLPKKIMLLGFDSPTLQEKRFFAYLSQKGCFLEPLFKISRTKPCRIKTLQFESASEEMNTMINWALHKLSAQPKKPIVCFIDNLKAQRDKIISSFHTAYLDLKNNQSHECPWSLPFETKPLIQHPIIQTALDILHLGASIDLRVLSRLLRSPYLEHTDRKSSKYIQLDRYLRNHNTLVFSLKQLVQWSQDWDCVGLAEIFKQLEASFSSTEKISLKDWVEHWSFQLKIWGWFKTKNPSKEEEQHFYTFKKALDDFSKTELADVFMSHTEALSSLMSHLNSIEMPFDRSPSTTGIHIIDIQHKMDVQFEACWVFNVEQIENSHTAQMNPFIPYTLQKAITKPTSLSSILEHLSQQTTYLVCSYQASFQLDTKTAALCDVIDASDLHLISYFNHIQKASDAFAWETFNDDWGPSLSNHQPVKGGIDLIKKQALCPFRAFSDYRLSLKAHTLTLPDDIPSYAEKAICLHRVLEAIWAHLKDQDSLQALCEPDLDHLLKSEIHQKVEYFAQKRPSAWTATFAKNEKDRLYHLIHKWLRVEKKRPPFKVKAVEYEHHFTLGPLKLSFIIDRIDQLSDQHFLLVDYKTSSQSPTLKSWEGERPNDPQLPIYAVSMNSKTQAIAWVHLTLESGGKFLGLSACNTDISGIHTSLKNKKALNWSDRLLNWQKTLEALAHQFNEGYARVDPKEGLLSCQYCPYSLLCRIHQSKN